MNIFLDENRYFFRMTWISITWDKYIQMYLFIFIFRICCITRHMLSSPFISLCVCHLHSWVYTWDFRISASIYRDHQRVFDINSFLVVKFYIIQWNDTVMTFFMFTTGAPHIMIYLCIWYKWNKHTQIRRYWYILKSTTNMINFFHIIGVQSAHTGKT